MSIIEAIQHAETEYAVYFLLTAYIESLWHSECADALRASVRKLPIEGQDDVQERARTLAANTSSPREPLLAEAAEIFEAASRRLVEARRAA